MNLIGRICIELIANSMRMNRFDPFKTISRTFRVWPHDIDLNIHLTASRYFSFADLSRIAWMAENNVAWHFLFKGFRGVVNAQEITYIREFRPFSRVIMESNLICWDEKYAYFEQRFYCKDALYAIAHVRMAIIYKKEIRSIDYFFQHLGHHLESPGETEVISDWKETLKAKRRQFEGHSRGFN